VNTKRAAAVLVALVLAETPSAIGAAAPELPWAVGTSWTYRVTVSRPNAFQSGTLKRAYGGRSTYRGKAVYSLDEDNTVVRGTEHDYFVWNGRYLSLVGQRILLSAVAIEIVYDEEVPWNVPAVRSGHALMLTHAADGDHRITVPWNLTVVDRGPVTITVPAGTFHARRWETHFDLGAIKALSSVDTVGLTAVREDIQQSDPQGSEHEIRELLRGPVP